MNKVYINELQIPEEFTIDVIALVYAGYNFTKENLDSLSLLDKDILSIDSETLNIANYIHNAIFTDLKLHRLKINSIKGSDTVNENEYTYLTREEIKKWFESKEIKCPEILLPRNINNIYKEADQRIKNNIEQLSSKQETLTQDSSSDKINSNIQINSHTYNNLIQAFNKFPIQFPDYETSSITKESVENWLKKDDINLASNDREKIVFTKILQEHYKFSVK